MKPTKYAKNLLGGSLVKDGKTYVDKTVSKVLGKPSNTTCKPCEKVAKNYR